MNGIAPAVLQSLSPVLVQTSSRFRSAHPNPTHVDLPEQSSVQLLGWGPGIAKEDQVGPSIFKGSDNGG